MYVLTPVVVEGIQNGDHSIQTWPVAFVALKALQTTHPSEVESGEKAKGQHQWDHQAKVICTSMHEMDHKHVCGS